MYHCHLCLHSVLPREYGHNIKERRVSDLLFVFAHLVSFVCTIYVQYCDQRRNEFFPQRKRRYYRSNQQSIVD